MTNMNTNANTDKIIDFLDDLTNKVGEGKHITLLAEKQDWFDAKRTLAQERLYGWDEVTTMATSSHSMTTTPGTLSTCLRRSGARLRLRTRLSR
jgi:hypothetical protein